MMMNEFSAVIMGKRLKLLRGEKSQDAVAKAIGISRGALSFYENGERKPDAETIFKICRYYNISADSLFGINRNTDFADLQGLIADINTTEIASHLNNMDEWAAKWRTEAEKALYKISEDCLK